MASSEWIVHSTVLVMFGLAFGLLFLVRRMLVHRAERWTSTPAPVERPVPQRPLWVVVVLTILTLGFYLFIWFGQSWSDLKRGGVNLDMSPSSHLWTMAMGPINGFRRITTHFRTINAQCALRTVPTGVGPRTALAMIISFILIPVLVVNGQRSLNRMWEQDFGPASRRTASAGEWVAIIALGLMYAPVVILSLGAA